MNVLNSYGVVGLGNMGRGIAHTLEKANLLARAWDLNPEACAASGVSPSLAASELSSLHECDALFLVVPGSAEIESLLDDGLLSAGTKTRVLIDLTTSYPEATRRLAERVSKAGVAYLDAGMTGGAAAAAEGRLTLMMGGEDAALASARAGLDAIADRIFHLGPVGAGHTMKLVHNMICHTIFLATAEGCRAAERAGVPLEKAVAVLNAGNARSFVSERRFPDHIVSETFDGRSHVSNLAKDLAAAARLFTADQPSPYTELSASILAAAVESGFGTSDFTRLYPLYDNLAASLRRQ